jgi:DNA-binding response OmpR family regulator/uncharacterized protein YbcI
MGSLSEARLPADTKVLVVGDDGMGPGVGRHRLDLDWHGAGIENALREFYELRPELVLVDCPEDSSVAVGLIEMLRTLCQVPILALADTSDAGVHALHAGADSVVPKPVSPEELDLRIRRVLSRAGFGRALLGDELVALDHFDRRVVVAGTEVDLTPTEFKLLAVFMEHPGAVLPHHELLEMAWGDAFRGEDQVKLYVSYLRRSFAAAGVDPIETVRGVGYAYRPRPSEPRPADAESIGKQARPPAPPKTAIDGIAESIGEIYRANFGNAPESVEMVRADEFVTAVLRGVFDRSDRALVELGRFPEVRRRRTAVRESLVPELRACVEGALEQPVRRMMSEVYESDLTTLTFLLTGPVD